ncbi:MAG: hypothetical protein R3247_14720, partial [Rhodothermales bacterium]|nr:hypothetical protein [Rhodothermales bacterium]
MRRVIYLDVSHWINSASNAKKTFRDLLKSMREESAKTAAALRESADSGGTAYAKAHQQAIRDIKKLARDARKQIDHIQNLETVAIFDSREARREIRKIQRGVEQAVRRIGREAGTDRK